MRSSRAQLCIRDGFNVSDGDDANQWVGNYWSALYMGTLTTGWAAPLLDTSEAAENANNNRR